MTAQGTILLEEDHARVIVGGQSEWTLAYDDVSGWDALNAGMSARPRFTAIVPATATLRMTLATAPSSERDFRAMLEASAPLALQDLLWTSASRSQDSAAPTVVLVKRDWLAPRVAAIRQMLALDDLPVVDAAREPFHYRTSPTGRDFRFAVAATAIVIALTAALAWQGTKPPLVAPKVATMPAPTAPRAEPTIAEPAPPAVGPPGKSELVLVGIAGRLPDDADVLVKAPWGKTSTMRMGDSLLGWTLVAVEPDRIVLEKDGARDELVLKPAA